MYYCFVVIIKTIMMECDVSATQWIYFYLSVI